MSFTARIGCGLLAALATSALLAQPLSSPGALPPSLQAELLTVLRQSSVLGAAVVLVDANGPTGALWFGTADAAQGTPLTALTCLRAGSVSKTFTALLAMRLADQGRLLLDEPLPADLQPPAPAHCPGQLTLAQLLEHTAGVAGSTHADYAAHEPDAPVADVGAKVARRSLRWCPGLHYSYSNDGIALAAAALERAGGADFDTLMRREVFSPLGMTGATFATGPPPACLARSYAADGSLIEKPWQLAVRPAGALVATPLELARAVQMFLRYGNGPSGHVLEPCSQAHMATGASGLAGRHGATAGAYGRGLFRFVAADRLMIGHWGRIDGFQTTLAFAPELGRGMVIMVNTADRQAMDRLRTAVARELWREAPAATFPASARPADGIDGWYANHSHDMALRAPWVAMLDIVRIERDEKGLSLRGLWPWQGARRVFAVTPTAFRDEHLPLASMAFAAQADGERWWVDGESYAAVNPALAVTQLAALVLGLLACVASMGRVLASTLRRLMMRRSPRSAPRGGVVDLLLGVSGLAFLLMIAGYAAFGLFGVGTDVGRPGAVGWSLAALSVIGPAAALAAAALLARRGGGAVRAILTVCLTSLGALCWANGWLPLTPWRA